MRNFITIIFLGTSFGFCVEGAQNFTSIASLFRDAAAIYAASEIPLGRQSIYSNDTSLGHLITCGAWGWLIEGVSTLAHEFGHATASWYLNGERADILVGSSSGYDPYAVYELPYGCLIVGGLNPCRGYTFYRGRYRDNRPGNWRNLGVSMAGGIAGICCAHLLKMLFFLLHDRVRLQRSPLQTIKRAFKESFWLDAVTVSNLYCLFWPFSEGNDGSYWLTFLFGKS